MRRLQALLMLALCLVAPAGAAAQITPDEEVARREYRAGAEAYERNDYEVALTHFSAARTATHLPALDFNIGRCLDRLGRWREAADAYEHYLAATPDAENSAELRARVLELRNRNEIAVGVSAPSAAPTPPSPRLRLAAGLTLGGAVLVGAAGAAVYGVAYHDFANRRDVCNQLCPPSSLGGLRSEVRANEIASGVLWGVAGVALIGDVVLWALDARSRRARVDVERGIVRF